MTPKFTTSYIQESTDLFHYYKKLGERAMEQAPDAALFQELDAQSNSIAIIVKHLAGNMRSRWMDFLTSDGEKPDRHRDTEFEAPPKTREEVLALWNQGWQWVFSALEPLSDNDLTRTVTIRQEPYSVLQAINRQIGHYAYHVGQMVYLARHFAGDRWQSLTIPRGKSGEFNSKVASGDASQHYSNLTKKL